MATTKRTDGGAIAQTGSSSLRVHLLGEVAVRSDDDREWAIASARARSLLGYLIVHEGLSRSPRQRLAFLLWPDSTEAQARTNLRNVLHVLRRACPAARWLRGRGRDDVAVARWRLVLGRSARFAFLPRTLPGALPRDGRRIVALRDAVDLYRGDLLEECYDEWAVAERERLRDRYVAALRELRRVVGRPGRPRRGDAARAGGDAAGPARRDRLPAAHGRARRRW